MTDIAQINTVFKKRRAKDDGPDAVRLLGIRPHDELPFVVEPVDGFAAPYALSSEDASTRYGISPNLPQTEATILHNSVGRLPPSRRRVIEEYLAQAEADGRTPRNLTKARQELAEAAPSESEADINPDTGRPYTPEERFAEVEGG